MKVSIDEINFSNNFWANTSIKTDFNYISFENSLPSLVLQPGVLADCIGVHCVFFYRVITVDNRMNRPLKDSSIYPVAFYCRAIHSYFFTFASRLASE